jgi:NADH-quinone oxidoreductase subunit I
MAKGMLTTLKFFLHPAATVQYPKVRRTLPERSRTMFMLPMDEAGLPACKACMLCAKNCPDGAITMTTEKRADGPGRVLTHYSIDLGLCMYCGICVESCPSDGVAFTGDYERATADKDDTLVVLWDAPYAAPPTPAETPASAEPPAPPAAESPGEAVPDGGGDAE